MQSLIPTGDRLLVLPNETADVFDGQERNILKPDVAKERPCEGTVIAVGLGIPQHSAKPGEGREDYGPLLKPGTQVLYGKFSGSEIKIDAIEMVILCLDDILGIVDSKADIKAAITAAGREVPKYKGDGTIVGAGIGGLE